MKTIELYKALNIKDNEFKEIVERLGRYPNELETYLFSAMWSEHCGYKHSKKYLSRLPLGGAVSAGENAGGIKIGKHVVVFKAESHNHPSAVEPYQGAATGIGGIVRDILAIGARPIALLDSLKFGPLNDNYSKHIFEGVVSGISGYGNAIGVPTVAGEVLFDDNYKANPLVNVMAVGIVEEDKIQSAKAIPNNKVILMGAETGRDGIHGASFASKELSGRSGEDRPSVQIGDPFMKKLVIEATLEIVKIKNVLACQDLGAAGLLSSSAEMADKGNCGINLYLDRVHVREDEMQPWEIMLSESQERMLFVVEDSGVQEVLDICNKYGIPSSVIGETIEEQEYRLFFNSKLQACVPPKLLTEGIFYDLNEEKPLYIDEYANKKLNTEYDIKKAIYKIVANPNFVSKEWIYSKYDHMVGTRTVLKPGVSSSSGIWAYEEGGVIGVTIDSLPLQAFLDPYEGTRNAAWKSFRNLTADGFNPLGITDCMNYGNPEKNEAAYQFVKSIDGLAQACKETNIPVASGNVSFYNETETDRVYPTATIGAIGYINNYKNIIRSHFKSGESVYVIGKQLDENSSLGGSLYQKILFDFIGGKVDKTDVELEFKLREFIDNSHKKELLGGCRSVSYFGIFGALFKSLATENIGFEGEFPHSNDLLASMFGEITGRYLVSTRKDTEIESLLCSSNIPYKKIGLCKGSLIKFNGFNFNIDELIDSFNLLIQSEMER
ncbi:MAG: phosphoribosylformylglycinamidine synthase subunit PurL [bacterium]